jgi:hypothetical protein
MEKEKFRISIIDFLPENGKFEVGKDKNGNTICLGDMVDHNDKKNWFVSYRYGKIMLKQVGMMAMIGSPDFDKGDFSSVEKVMNTIGAGPDWLIIGYTDEPMYKRLKLVGILNS